MHTGTVRRPGQRLAVASVMLNATQAMLPQESLTAYATVVPGQ